MSVSPVLEEADVALQLHVEAPDVEQAVADVASVAVQEEQRGSLEEERERKRETT